MKYLHTKNSVHMLFCIFAMLSTLSMTAQTTTTAYGSWTALDGLRNSYFGYSIQTSTSVNNTAMGHRIGRVNPSTNASNNTVIGFETGLLGTRNVFFGAEVADQVSQGSNNVFLGNCSSCNTLGYANKNVFIGDRTGALVGGNMEGNVLIGYAVGNSVRNNNKLIIDNTNLTTALIYGDFATDKLGINTKNLPSNLNGEDLSSYSLYVEGGLLTEKLRVQPNWADYVFEADYKLMSLENVEKFIEENGHLPNVPSAEAVQQTGIELGDIKRIQQEKIEELTLYIIDLNEQLQLIKAQLAAKKAAKKSTTNH